MVTSGAAGKQAQFEGADGFVGIIWMDTLGGSGIQSREEAADCAWAAGLASQQAGAEGVIALGAGGEAVEQGAEVESCAAAENREATAGRDLRKNGEHFGNEITGGKEVCGRAEVEEMVRDAALGGGGQLGGTDVEAGVNLDGIEVDNLAVKSFGEGESEGGLPCPGGSGNGEERKVGHPA